MGATTYPPLRPEIDTSWRRSAVNGLDPGMVPDVFVDEDVTSCDRLLRVARPILDVARDQLADTDVALLLTDSESRLITRLFGGSAVETHLDRLGAVHGSRMSEDSVGTTALGTPVEIRQPITINGAEHYLEMYKHLSCYGYPILHPTTRRLEGILCMTSVSTSIHPLFRPFVQGLATDIQSSLLDHSRASHQMLLDAFHRAGSRRGVAAIAIGDDMLLTNDAAVELTDPADIAVLRSIAASTDSGLGDRAPERLTLSSGIAVRVTTQRVAGSRAAVFVLTPERGERPSIPRVVAPATGHADEVFSVEAFTPSSAHCSLAISGEPGTGRSTYARTTIGSLRAEVVDVALGVSSGSLPGITEAASTARATDAVLVVDDVELLSDADATALRRVVTDRAQPVVLVTGPSSSGSPTTAALSALCTDHVELAPIRNRPLRIRAAIAYFLERRSPGMHMRPAAIDMLIAHDWPANYTELDHAVTHAGVAAGARGVTAIDVDDLPAHLRRTGRSARLTLHDRVERQGIIDALNDCQGNKVHAAKQLGISRSTLYSRIRALRIES